MGAGRIHVAALPMPTLEYDSQDQEQFRSSVRASLEDVERIVADIEANVTAEIALIALDDLSDVTETSVGADEVLGYSSGWKNRTLAEAGISAVGHTHSQYGDITSGVAVSGAWTWSETLKTINTTFITQWEGVGPNFLLRHYRDGGSGTAWCRFQQDEGSIATPVATPSDRWIGGLNWAGSTGSGFTDMASILCVANEAISATNQGNRIRLRATRKTASVVTDVMQIYGEGVVIGQSDQGTTLPFGGGKGVVFLQNRGTAPTSNPSGGGVLYAQAGSLRWKGSSGTLTTLALA